MQAFWQYISQPQYFGCWVCPGLDRILMNIVNRNDAVIISFLLLP